MSQGGPNSSAGSGSPPVETLTGNSGGAVGPDGSFNIDVLGNNTTGIDVIGTPASSLLTIVGIPSSDTQVGTTEFATTVETGELTDDTRAVTPAGLEPILVTPYVVAPGGAYTTIQSAIDAANADGGGTVYIRPGSYTEDLTLYSNIELYGATAEVDINEVTITGIHTPPTSGVLSARNINFISATDVFNSAFAGTTDISIVECVFTVTNGFTFNLDNWTGEIRINDCGSGGTNDGFFNNSGGATLFTNNSELGSGTSNTMLANGVIRFDLTLFNCPMVLSGAVFNQLNIAFFLSDITLGGSAFYSVANGCAFFGSITLSDSSIGTSVGSNIQSGSSPAITMSSSGDWTFANSLIDTTNNPAIAGAGVGTLNLANITFLDDDNISGTVNVVYPGPTEVGNLYAQNISFDRGTTLVSTDGQLIIGKTGSNPDIGTITSTTLTVGYSTPDITIETGAAVPIQFDTDAGSAVPALGILTVAGGTNMNTAGAASTVTINLDLDVLGLTDLTVDNLELNGNTISSTDTNGEVIIDPDGIGGAVITTDLTVGLSNQDTTFTINGASVMAQLALHTEAATDLAGYTQDRNGNTAAFGAHEIFLRSRGTHLVPTIIQDDDSIVRIVGAGFDGTDYAEAAEIQIEVDGTPGADDMPGRIVFLTSPDGTQVPIEALRIDSSQVLTLANALTVANGGTGLSTITDHAVLIGAGTSAITPVGPVAATGAILASNGVGSDPGFTTATYPLTSVVNEILYSSSTNTITGLATANRAVLTTGATGIPVMTALATDGQLIIGSTAGVPAAANITAGSNISITNGSNSITIDANSAGQIVNVTALTEADTDYTVLSTDYYLSCNVNGGILTIDLPDAGTTGRVVIIKDSGGDAATNNITVTTVTGTDTIDGATTFVMNTNYEAANFLDNGTSWEVF